LCKPVPLDKNLMAYHLSQGDALKGVLVLMLIFVISMMTQMVYDSKFYQTELPQTVLHQTVLTSLDDVFHIDSETSPARAENLIHSIMKQRQFYCPLYYRAGNRGDGGWDVCMLPRVAPKPGCIVYSFGIKNDWSFDEAMSNHFGCQVKAWDPSTGKSNHTHSEKVKFFNLGLGGSNHINKRKWTMRTFSSLLKDQGHEEDIIDFLKFDIEGSEWEVIPNMYKEHSWRNVKQIAFEVHIDKGANANVSTWMMQLETMKLVNRAGFLKWHDHENQISMQRSRSSRSGLMRPCCYELYYVNKAFL